MSQILHPDIVVTETPESVHYCLPQRDAPLVRQGARAVLMMAAAVWSVPFVSAWFMGRHGDIAWAMSLATLVPVGLFSGT
jgi:hypothetical protein